MRDDSWKFLVILQDDLLHAPLPSDGDTGSIGSLTNLLESSQTLGNGAIDIFPWKKNTRYELKLLSISSWSISLKDSMALTNI